MSTHISHFYTPDFTLPCVPCGEDKNAACHLPSVAAALPLREGTDPLQFRKKPVVVEAVQYAGNGNMHPRYKGCLPDWLWEALEKHVAFFSPAGTDPLTIRTLEGDHLVFQGDWIIRGVKGELYPCKPDIFAATYESVAAPAPRRRANQFATDAIGRCSDMIVKVESDLPASEFATLLVCLLMDVRRLIETDLEYPRHHPDPAPTHKF